MLQRVDDVAHDGGGGGQVPRAPSVEHHVAYGVAPDHNGVEHVVHRRDGTVPAHQMGGHIGRLPPVRQTQGPAQQLHPVSGLAGNGHILQIQSADSLDADLLRQDLLPPGQIREDAYLPPCVQPLHVGGGILLGVALGLGLLQGLVKGDAALHHPGEDIVGGPIEDAHDFLDLIPRQALEQGAQHGNAPAHAGLEEVVDVFLPGNRKEFLPVGSHQLLVGGNHMLAGHQGPAGKVQGDFSPADGFHHHVQIRIVLQHGEILYRHVGVGGRG